MINNTLYSLLKNYSIKQNNANINFIEFADYIKRYAQHHFNEQRELTPYLSNPGEALDRELEDLQAESKVAIIAAETDHKAIIITDYYINKINLRYLELENNAVIPYPLAIDLPKNVPTTIFQRHSANDFIYQLLEKPYNGEPCLFGLTFPRELPILLLPSIYDPSHLVDIAVSKIRQLLKKDESHDYFLKKIRISNPGKELSAKNFFFQVVSKPTETLDAIKKSGDTFYFWSQLCYFIRQDYEKLKDLTPEDVAILQSVYLTEYSIAYYKTKTTENQQKANALKELDQIINKPPYYFDKEAIARFVDNKGVPLLGQYSEEDLNEYLHRATVSNDKNSLPRLLVFKIETEQRFFILKTKVIPLIVRLCSDVREQVKNIVTKEWYTKYKRFETDTSMKDQVAFNARLEKEVRMLSPVLYALLNSNFLSLVYFETQSSQEPVADSVNLFVNGVLVSYSELLMLSRQEIITDAKIMLPFWYTIPVISWIIAFLFKPIRKKDKSITNEKKIKKTKIEDADIKATLEELDTNLEIHADSEKKHKNALKNAAENIEKQLIPEGSSLENELDVYESVWNKMLDKAAKENLKEDVNSLTRDYFRRILRTIKANTFSAERIKDLAVTLVKTPSMQKIKDTEELTKYIQLYLLHLIKNLK